MTDFEDYTAEDFRLYNALTFAHAAHAAVGQLRKYTLDPYIVHPMAVSGLVAKVDGTLEMVMAAVLHDVVEDTKVTATDIRNLFGDEVGDMVSALTDVYTKEAVPHLNRAARKEAEAKRYANLSYAVKTIKLADMIDNTKSISEFDPGFFKTYAVEKRRLLESLVGGNERLYEVADTILRERGY